MIFFNSKIFYISASEYKKGNLNSLTITYYFLRVQGIRFYFLGTRFHFLKDRSQAGNKL